MCGRFEFSLKDDKKGKQIKERAEKLNLVYKEGEIFPTDQVLCIIPMENKIDLSVMKWGVNGRSLQINARKESLDDKPSYNEIRNNRCAVICNGFYEWNKHKDKFYISGDEEYMYLACIFNKKKELLIITQASDGEFSKIHERIPMIMNQKEMLKYIHNEDGVFEKKKLKIEKTDDALKLF
ncbi:MAG: SOS response-associated peptidase family protein [Erysipelotrichaceae bacterium]|nr:SOS response-associated peptidase family protein [Erysipelotrichaceae bacterium]